MTLSFLSYFGFHALIDAVFDAKFNMKEIAVDAVLSHFAVSVTELKRNYADILKQADDAPVAVLNHNRPEAYLLPAHHYERLLAHIEDLEDAKLVRERTAGPFVEVSLDSL